MMALRHMVSWALQGRDTEALQTERISHRFSVYAKKVEGAVAKKNFFFLESAIKIPHERNNISKRFRVNEM